MVELCSSDLIRSCPTGVSTVDLFVEELKRKRVINSLKKQKIEGIKILDKFIEDK